MAIRSRYDWSILGDQPNNYWDFNDGTGSDKGLDNISITKSGTTLVDGKGKTKAWEFNGTSDYASIASGGTLSGTRTAFTVEAVVKFDTSITEYPTIVRRDGTDIFLLRARSSNIPNPGVVEAFLGGKLVATTQRVDDGQWHHIACVVAGNNLKIYIDGTQRANSTLSKSSFDFGTGPTYIGAGEATGGVPNSAELLRGSLDSLALFNVNLSAAQVSDHSSSSSDTNLSYNTGVLYDNPNYYYKLDETSGTSFSGATTSYPSASMTGTSVTANADAGPSGRAVAMGPNSRLNASSINHLSMMGPFEFWIKTASTNVKVMHYYADGFTYRHLNINPSGYLTYNARGGSNTGGYSLTSSVAINDDRWHHVLISQARYGEKFMYIDGVQVDSANATLHNSSVSGSLAFGNSNLLGAAELDGFTGLLDEIVIHPTTSSSTELIKYATYERVLNAKFSTTVDLSKTALTINSKEATQESPFASEVNLEAPQLSLSAKDNTVETVRIDDRFPSLDGRVHLSTGVWSQGENSTVRVEQGVYGMALRFDYPIAGVTEMFEEKLYLRNVASSGSSPSLRVWSIVAPWSGGGTPIINRSAGYVTADQGSWYIGVDVSSIIDPENFYGFFVERYGGTSGVYSDLTAAEYENPNHRPTFRTIYEYIPASVEVELESAQLELETQYSDIAINQSVTADVAVLEIDTLEPLVEVTESPNAIVDLGINNALFGSKGETIEIPISVYPEATGFELTPQENEIELTQSILVEAMTARLTSRVPKPIDVNGIPLEDSESDDGYFVSTEALQPWIWYRGNTLTGDRLLNRGRSAYNAGAYRPDLALLRSAKILGSVQVGVPEGIDSRKVLKFDGNGYLEQMEPDDGDYDKVPLSKTLEFTIRTTKKDQFLMGGRDRGDTDKYYGEIDWRLRGGKIEQTRTRTNTGADLLESFNDPRVLMSGFKDIADGQWHHVVIIGTRSGDDTGRAGMVEIWIDGKLDVRRYNSSTYGTYSGGMMQFAFPDFIGGRSGSVGGTVAVIDPSDWFVGEMGDLIYYNRVLDRDQVRSQRDAAFGVLPARPAAGRYEFNSQEPVVKGNKKQALIIDYHTYPSGVNGYNYGQPYVFDAFGHSFREDPVFRESGARGLNRAIRGEKYNFFRVSAFNHIDRVEGRTRLLDLNQDLNIEEYDTILVMGYPQTSNRYKEIYENGGEYGQSDFYKLLDQIKTAAVNGTNLHISSPYLAADLGFIKSFELTKNFKNADEPIGLVPVNGPFRDGTDYGVGYDAISSNMSPWPEPYMPSSTSRTRAALQYVDTHANYNFRVRNLVPGLTDIGSFILTDRIEYWEPRYWADSYFALKYENRMVDGLSIGDEFYYEGIGMNMDYNFDMGGLQNLYDRQIGAYGTKISDVAVGKVVTSFGAKVSDGAGWKDNPYADYATVIAAEPGDKLPDGRSIAGKIFITIAESVTNELSGYTMPMDVVPSNEDQIATLPENRRHLEGPERRQWNFSTWRRSNSSYSISPRAKVTYSIAPDGQLVATSSAGGEDYDLTASNYWWPRVDVPFETMSSRGWKWLAADAEEEDGSVTVGLEAPQMASESKDYSSLEVSRSEEVNAMSGRMVFAAINDDATEPKDAEIVALTPGITVAVAPFKELVDVDAAVINFAAQEDQSTAIDAQDTVGLTLFTGGPRVIKMNLREET